MWRLSNGSYHHSLGKAHCDALSCNSSGLRSQHGMLLRPATSRDAAAISRVVLAALRESNSQDYPPDVIAKD